MRCGNVKQTKEGGRRGGEARIVNNVGFRRSKTNKIFLRSINS